MSWDPIHDGRDAFRSCLDAICSPGVPTPLSAPRLAEDVRLDAAAGILLSLLDPGIALAFEGGREVSEIAAALSGATGAALVDVAAADFVLIGSGARPGAPARARRGTPLRPDHGATLVYAGSWPEVALDLVGPGVESVRRTSVPLPSDDPELLEAVNRAEPPTGVDALIALDNAVVAIPRGVRASLVEA